jgi:hypothetical protein
VTNNRKRKSLTSKREIDYSKHNFLVRVPQEYVAYAPKTHFAERLLRERVHVFEQLGKKPLQRVVEADPPIQNVKRYDRVDRRSELDFVKRDRVEFRPIQSFVRERDRHEDVVCNSSDGCD